MSRAGTWKLTEADLDDELEVIGREYRSAVRALIKAAEQWSQATVHERTSPTEHRNLRSALGRVIRARDVERRLGVIDVDEYEEMTDEERLLWANRMSGSGLPLPKEPLPTRRSRPSNAHKRG